MIHKLIFCLAFMFLAPFAMRGEILKGRVVDAETSEPLERANVEITEEIPDFCTSVVTFATDKEGYFRYETSSDASRLTFVVKFFGYHNQTIKRVSIGGSDTLSIPDIKLKPSAVLLKELSVNAKARRFYMKGDTVVFNPEAFRVEEGDRLITLVEKLPGVTVKDGKLLWNGQPLIVMMNGKDALSQQMLLNQLPVVAVDKIKAYERTGELQDRTGVADGNQEHVLDVSIKPGFMDRFYTSAEARAYTGKEYATQLDATKLSDSHPMMIFARVADDPHMVNTRTMGSWSSGTNLLPVRQQAGALAYRHLWKPKDVQTKRDSRWDITVGANHWDKSEGRWEQQHVFMAGKASTQSYSTSDSYDHRLMVPVDFTSYLNLSPKNTLSLNANFSFVREQKEQHTQQETTELDTDTKANSSDYQSLDTKKGISANADARLTHYLTGGALSTKVRIEYENMQQDGSSVGQYLYHQTGLSYLDRQCFDSPNHKLLVGWDMDFNKTMGQSTMLHGAWETNYSNHSQDENRWRNDVLDFENSSSRKNDRVNNILTLDANYKTGAFSLKPILRLQHQHERTDYRRAQLDTVALRNLLTVRSTLEMNYRLQKQMNLKATLGYQNRPADLIDCIGYQDNTNPLYIRMGNPNLKMTHTLEAGLLYTAMLTKHGQALSFSLKYQKKYDPIGTVLHYNSTTGGYREQKQNVRGGNMWSGNLSYDRDLTEDLQLKSTLHASHDRTFGIMTLVDEATHLIYNRQSQTQLKEDLSFRYEHLNWSVYWFHVFTWNGYAYTEASHAPSDIFNYETELRIRYRLGSWKFTLSPQFIFDHGYHSNLMNGGQFLLNAQVDYSLLKNRAELILKADDLLNQQKHNFSSFTATTQAEGGERFMHQYLSFTFRYRFDPRSRDKK